MPVKEEHIKEAYHQTKNIYDKVLTGKTIWFKMYNAIGWGVNDSDYVGKVLDLIPEGFKGKLLDIPVGTAVFTYEKCLF